MNGAGTGQVIIMFHDDAQKGGLVISPKASFVLGLIGGALVLCTIGFFILLVALMSGMIGGKSAAPKQAAAVVNQAPAPSPSPSAPQPSAPSSPVAAVTAADHVRGTGTVTLIEYSDYQCPFCQRFHSTMQQVMKDYSGKVRWVFRHYPLSFHPNAQPAALAAECAAEQGKFWEFTDAAYENQNDLGDALYSKIASDLKLNKSKFDSCVSSKKFANAVTDDQSSGSSAGVDGTPATFIVAADGSQQLVPGALPYEQVKPMIDAALAK